MVTNSEPRYSRIVNDRDWRMDFQIPRSGGYLNSNSVMVEEMASLGSRMSAEILRSGICEFLSLNPDVETRSDRSKGYLARSGIVRKCYFVCSIRKVEPSLVYLVIQVGSGFRVEFRDSGLRIGGGD